MPGDDLSAVLVFGDEGTAVEAQIVQTAVVLVHAAKLARDLAHPVLKTVQRF